MICFDTENGRFNFRSVAVIIHDDHILIHRAVADDFWALPGGRVELFETSGETVVREIHEELGLQCKVERHLWHVENFFEFGPKRFHELANYFLVSFNNQPVIESEIDFEGIETPVDLLFRSAKAKSFKTRQLKVRKGYYDHHFFPEKAYLSRKPHAPLYLGCKLKVTGSIKPVSPLVHSFLCK